jgi:hypothetical protein
MRHARRNLGLRKAQQLQRIGQICPHRAPQHNRALKDIGLALLRCFGRCRPGDRTAGDPFNPMQNPQKRGFSRTIWPLKQP